MSMVRLEMSEDELRDLLTRIYHETEYYIDKKDPIIIEYLMHKIILRQFADQQGKVLGHFADTFLPYLREADEKFESKKVAFTEYAETKQKEVLASITSTYHKQINATTTSACERILDSLKIMIAHLYEQERDLLSRIKDEHRSFEATAEWFAKCLRWTACILGSSAFLAAMSLIVYLHFFY